MNHKMTCAAGLIFACTALLQLRAAGPNAPDDLHPQTGTSGLPKSENDDSWVELQNIGRKNLTVAIEIPEVFKVCCRTNRVLHHESAEPVFPLEIHTASVEDWPQNAALRGTDSASGFQLRSGAGQSFDTDGVDARPANRVILKQAPEISLFENFTGDDIFDWLYEPAITNTSPARKSPKKTQTVVITPVPDEEPESEHYPSYAACFAPSKHAWYGWISPELILTQWAQYWFDEVSEEDMKTVVLMRISF